MGAHVFDAATHGMFVWADFGHDTNTIAARGAQEGILCAPGSLFSPTQLASTWMRLGCDLHESDRLAVPGACGARLIALVLFRRHLDNQPITDARLREQVAWSRRIGLDLLAQLFHVDAQVMRVVDVVRAHTSRNNWRWVATRRRGVPVRRSGDTRSA